eukprot:gnl/TRDRNA2_/TRDRNA2_133755_c0_seq1.p1 gnl/TRDRNA2_/TRDRNA2_133755_c0~~gnl/TRDRNA2_/TRDRNA2_133755_c0_seq1.p1  ORF type:complete len:1203 (+),score=159.47 gnl/TRDRNA2_/TRDRNA2_133755_c0_seq1:40-3609(+)
MAANSNFALLAVLGNGGGRITGHHRFPIAAYQAGSILVLWDYVKGSGESRKFVLLQPNQCCTWLFFSKDAQSLLGFWLSQGGQPTFTVWRVTDGAKISEQALSDKVGGPTLLVDFHAETSHFVMLHAGPAAATVSVIYWHASALRLHYAAHGHIGALESALGIRLLDDGRHFVTGEASAVKFWSFAEQTPRLVLKIDLDRPVAAFEVFGRWVYLMPRSGRVRLLDFEGKLEQLCIVPPSGGAGLVSFTAIAVRSAFLCLGATDGALYVYDALRLELRRRVAPPAEAGGHQSMSPVASSRAVSHVALGMNEDYACVCFADGTHGVAHLESGQYVALRVGHCSSVRSIAMAPYLQLRPGLEGRLMDPDRLRLTRTIAFLTLGSDDTNWITWPRRGPPVRNSLYCQSAGVGREESYAPQLQLPANVVHPMHGQPLVLTAAAFHPEACLSNDGRLAGAYKLLIGTSDGSLQYLESSDDGSSELSTALVSSGPPPASSTAQDSTMRLSWLTKRVRPPAPELCSGHDSVIGGSPAGPSQHGFPSPGTSTDDVCCHISFSRCGRFVSVSSRSGFAEVLHFPALARAVVVQGVPRSPLGLTGTVRLSDSGRPVGPKAFFAWHPLEEQRTYDQNLYVVSHTADPRELVLYEVYLLRTQADYAFGSTHAKASRHEFVLPEQRHRHAPGSSASISSAITDFCIHPSQLFLVMAAVFSEESAVLVYDLWTGRLLKVSAVFTSLLITPLTLRPLQPSVCADASGTFLFCSSSPVLVGSLDQNFGQPWSGSVSGGGGALVSDSLLSGRPAADRDQLLDGACNMLQRASVVCIIDFDTGKPVYQASVEVSCLALGSLAHDPTQLLLGAHDGTISVWHPPQPVSSRIQEALEQSKREYIKHHAQQGLAQEGIFSTTDLEVSVAWQWKVRSAAQIDWTAWGVDLRTSLESNFQLASAKPAVTPSPCAFAARTPWAACGDLDALDAALAAAPSADAGADADDVVVQARHESLFRGARAPLGPVPLGPTPLPPMAPSAPSVERDPISGLDVMELPGAGLGAWLPQVPCRPPYAGPGGLQSSNGLHGERAVWPALQTAGRSSVACYPAQGVLETGDGNSVLVAGAPELREVFGGPQVAGYGAPTSLLPRRIEKGRAATMAERGGAVAMQAKPDNLGEEEHFAVVEGVYEDIARFERQLKKKQDDQNESG